MVTLPSSVRGGYRRGASFALRVALAAAIVWWLIRRVGWDEFVATVGHARPLAHGRRHHRIMLRVGGEIVELGAAAGQSRLLQRGSPSRALARLHGGIVSRQRAAVDSEHGCDARVLFAQRLFGGRPTAHAAAIIINNLLVWIAACSLGLVCMGVLFARGQLPDYEYLAAPLFLGVVVAGVGLHVALKYYRRLWLLALRRVLRRRWYFLRRAIRRLADALLIFERAHVQFAPRAIVALLAAISSTLVFAGAARAVGVELPLIAWGVIVPLVSLCGLLPISIAGVGGAQAVHVLLLAPFGVSVAQAFASSALYALLNIMFIVVLGSVSWLFAPAVLTRTPEAALRISQSPEK